MTDYTQDCSEQIVLNETVNKNTDKAINDDLLLTDELIKIRIINLNENVSLDESINKTTNKNFAGNYQNRLITITNNDATTYTDLQVKLTLDLTNVADGTHIVFHDNSDDSLIPHYLESGAGTSNGIVWVKIPTLTASSSVVLVASYGIDVNSGISSGEDVFLLYDNFDGVSLDTDKWTVSGTGTCNISSGIMTLNGNETSVSVTSNTSFGINTIFESYFKNETYGTGSGIFNGKVYLGYNANGEGPNFGGPDIVEYSYLYRFFVYNKKNYLFNRLAGYGTDYTTTTNITTYSKLGIHRINSASNDFYKNDSYLNQNTSFIPLTSQPIRLGVGSIGVGDVNLFVDWVRVRNLTTTLPSISISGEYNDRTIILNDYVNKYIEKTLSDGIVLTDELTIYRLINLNENINLNESIDKDITKYLLESNSLNESVSKIMSKTLSDSITVMPYETDTIYKTLNESMSLYDNVYKTLVKTFDSYITLDEDFNKKTYKEIDSIIALNSSLVKSIDKGTLLENIELTDLKHFNYFETLTDNISLSEDIIVDKKEFIDQMVQDFQNILLDIPLQELITWTRNTEIEDSMGRQSSISTWKNTISIIVQPITEKDLKYLPEGMKTSGLLKAYIKPKYTFGNTEYVVTQGDYFVRKNGDKFLVQQIVGRWGANDNPVFVKALLRGLDND